MQLGVLVVAGVSALGLAVPPPPEARVPVATAGSCAFTGHVNVLPGVDLKPKDFAFTLEGEIAACRMPNREIRSGRVTAKGTGHGDCFRTRVRTPFAVEWDGGRKRSTGKAEGVTGGPFAVAAGTLDGGDYKGTPWEAYLVLQPKNPLRCGAGGVTFAEFTGQITFDVDPV